MPTQITGQFTFADWKEQPVGTREEYPRLAHASVANDFTGGIEAAATSCEYILVYATEKTGTFTGLELFSGAVDGRRGTFVVEERGHFVEDGTVHCTFEVVPGTATGDLAGLTGTGRFAAAAGQPTTEYTFSYELT
ncbi:DUF3224 domain-containing protein [Kitasatospora sp. NPDC004240]